MADGEGTAGTVIKDVSPALGLIPIAGPILSTAASIGGGLLQADSASKQADEAKRIRANALATPKENLRPEYLASLHMARMKALSGLPGIETDKGDLAQQLADQIRYIRMAAPGGNAALSAMGRASANNSASLRGLQAKDAEFRSNALTDVGNTLWNTGDKQRDLEVAQRVQRNQGLTAASAMENAAQFNKQRGIDTILGGIAKGGNQIFDNIMKTNGQSDNSQTANNGSSSESSRQAAEIRQRDIDSGYINENGKVNEINPITGAPNITYSSPDGKARVDAAVNRDAISNPSLLPWINQDRQDYSYFKYGYDDIGTGKFPTQNDNFDYSPSLYSSALNDHLATTSPGVNSFDFFANSTVGSDNSYSTPPSSLSE